MCLFVCEAQGLYLPCDCFKSGADAVFVLLYTSSVYQLYCVPSPAFFLIHMLCQCLLLSRFGKKKEEKKEAKAALQRQKSDLLSDHELERMKEERERWGGFYL